MLFEFSLIMNFSVRFLGFAVLVVCLQGCQYFMSPKKMLENTEADELCYQWKEQTRKVIVRFDMDYTLFNRGCQLDSDRSLYLGYEGNYLTGNQEQDRKIMSGWTVVKTFNLKN